VAEPPVTFAGLLRKLRTDAGLTQEELAGAASLSTRSISDLERGINQTARKDTARLLADALRLTGMARAEFEAAARGQLPAGESPPGGTAAPSGAVAAATRTLPRDIASFTGREDELRQLVDAAARAADSAGPGEPGGPGGPGGVVGIHAIGGMAGVGKTAFVVHAAHQLAPRFPGGQIFLPLHGHTPGHRPVDPADALASLLLTAGVPAQQIPARLEERMALWRDRLAGKQLLLVLDDAADSDQVRPLLPGTGGSLVLVTSRRHLSALEDAQAISLDILSAEQAAGLLVRLAARPGLDQADAAVAEITRLCGYLPLAVGMLARQLHHHPAWSPAELAADLAEARDRLDLMQAENLSVTAAFNLSYQDLTQDQQLLFRRLGLHPGTDIDAYAAAALDDTSQATARRTLQALYDQYLLAEPTRGRYRMHDLIREHASTLAARDDPGEDREQAVGRLLGYYRHAAERADHHITRYVRPGPVIPEKPGPAAPPLPDRTRSLAWARAERANLLACLDHATRSGQDAHVIALTAAIAGLLHDDGPWPDAIARHAAAAQAAGRLADRLGEAGALRDLGIVRRLTGDNPGAARALADALALYRDIGDRLGQANTLDALGSVGQQTGELPDAADALEEALALYRDIGDRLGQANALVNLGIVRRATGNYAPAAEALQEALSIYRDLGDWVGQASALRSLGGMRYLTGDFAGAAEALEQAFSILRDLGDRRGEASALMLSGVVRRLVGDFPGATAALEAALAVYEDIGERLGQANALDAIGKARRQLGDYHGAAESLRAALNISRDIGYRIGQANSLQGLGDVLRLTGDYPAAAELLDEGLAIYREVGDRGGEATTLNALGGLQRKRGYLDEASARHREALERAREIDSAWDEAEALAGLSRCAHAFGRTAEAEEGLAKALEIFRRTGAGEGVEAAEVSAELAALRAGMT
jgi:tetratricopeptide (TPR) repeat protein/transcriptional regulator with XRE-family HTH domain